jgi:sugar-specific transcriptional regulator TrmB
LRVGRAVMQKELIMKLTEFGLTINQVKVYLSIVQSGKIHVTQISKNTLLHRQDIYKLLPKLEKMGLITRTISKPVMVEALPVERALERIIAKEKETADRRIICLETALKDIAGEIKQQPIIAEETQFTLLTTNVAMKNRINMTLKAKPGVFCIVSTIENLKGQVGHFYKQFFQILSDNKTRIHLILVGDEDPVELKRIVEKIAPRCGNFTAKAIEKCPSKDYQVVDSTEVWIATTQKMQAGNPSILWTNDPNIVKTYLENFHETWNNTKAFALLENAAGKQLALKVVST